MSKPLPSILGRLYDFFYDRVIYLKREKGMWKRQGHDYVDSTEEMARHNENTVEIPESNVVNKFGHFDKFVDLTNDRGVDLVPEDAGENEVETLGGGINDSLLAENLAEKFARVLGETETPNYVWLVVGILCGTGVGFAIRTVLFSAGVL